MLPFWFAPQPEGGRQEKRRKRRSSSSSPSRRRRRHRREERGRSRRRARSSTSPLERKGRSAQGSPRLRTFCRQGLDMLGCRCPFRAASRLLLYCRLRQHKSSRRDGLSKTGSQRPRGRDNNPWRKEPGTRLGVPVNGNTSSRNGTRVGTSGATPRPAKKATRRPGQSPRLIQRGSLRPPRRRLRKEAEALPKPRGTPTSTSLGPGHSSCSAGPKEAAQRPRVCAQGQTARLVVNDLEGLQGPGGQ